MKISTASLPLTLLTLGLAAGGCYTYGDVAEPIAGSAPVVLVSAYLEDAYFRVAYPDGPTREVITYRPRDGQICMALRETLTPLAEDAATPDPSQDPTVDDGGWVILTAQVDSESLDDGTPYLSGGLFWYDEMDGWKAYGDYGYAPEQPAEGFQMNNALWPITILMPDPTNITAIRGALPTCEALERPETTPHPEPTSIPQPTPI